MIRITKTMTAAELKAARKEVLTSLKVVQGQARAYTSIQADITKKRAAETKARLQPVADAQKALAAAQKAADKANTAAEKVAAKEDKAAVKEKAKLDLSVAAHEAKLKEIDAAVEALNAAA